MRSIIIILIAVAPILAKAQAVNTALQSVDTTLPSEIIQKLKKFSLSGYGAMNYYHFNWQTDTAKRDAIDNERFIIDFGYCWNKKIRLNTEIEFEHGGTGVDLEFDRFEEFGEFEFDVSKGGEVLIEQMNLEFTLHNWLNIKVGRVQIPFGMMYARSEPTDYLTATNSQMETQILPENWTDNGITVFGVLDKRRRLSYHLAFTNGLDGSAFNSANWIKRGNQRRFEMATAEDFALTARLDYKLNDNTLFGASFYGGNTSNNRPKPDLRVKTPLSLAELHFLYKKDPFYASAMVLYGELGNSEALSNQNRNLSNNLNVKRTPVGSAAAAAFAELGVVLLGKKSVLFTTKTNDKLMLYGRYDYYDTQFRTEGLIFNNPRWERQSTTIGAVYQLIPEVQFKAQYTMRRVGAPAPTSVNGGRAEDTFVAGFAFEF